MPMKWMSALPLTPILTMRTLGAETQRLSVRKDKLVTTEVGTQEFLGSPYIQMFSFNRYCKIKKKCCNISQSKHMNFFTSHPPSERHYYYKALWATEQWSRLCLSASSTPPRVLMAVRGPKHTANTTIFFSKMFPHSAVSGYKSI